MSGRAIVQPLAFMRLLDFYSKIFSIAVSWAGHGSQNPSGVSLGPSCSRDRLLLWVLQLFFPVRLFFFQVAVDVAIVYG